MKHIEDLFQWYQIAFQTKPCYSRACTCGSIFAVVKPPCSYYVLTTFHVLNLPRFATFCSFCDKFNNLRAKIIIGKLRQIEAEHGILGGFSFMIKVLFVCHGKPTTICSQRMQNVAKQSKLQQMELYIHRFYYYLERELLHL